MYGRVVEVTRDDCHLSLFRGFMLVSVRNGEGGGMEEIGRVPLDGLAAVVCNAHGLSYSNNLLLALADRGVGVVMCGPNHTPAALLWPVDGHHVQAGRMRAQAGAGLPLTKRLWRQLVVAKIGAQASALDAAGASGAGPLRDLGRRVRSGDPDNVEAQAARRYWPMMMGPDFRRDTGGDGANAMLNYGYAILRSGMARAVMAAGLHPSLGLHHANRLNPMCLVDDLMEPFRPVADLFVWRLRGKGHEAVTPAAKQFLVTLLQWDVHGPRGVTPLATCQERLAQSLAMALEAGSGDLDLPPPIAADLPLVEALPVPEPDREDGADRDE